MEAVPEIEVLDSIRTLMWICERERQAVAGFAGITVTDVMALSRLRAEGGMSQAELAAVLASYNALGQTILSIRRRIEAGAAVEE